FTGGLWFRLQRIPQRANEFGAGLTNHTRFGNSSRQGSLRGVVEDAGAGEFILRLELQQGIPRIRAEHLLVKLLLWDDEAEFAQAVVKIFHLSAAGVETDGNIRVWHELFPSLHAHKILGVGCSLKMTLGLLASVSGTSRP